MARTVRDTAVTGWSRWDVCRADAKARRLDHVVPTAHEVEVSVFVHANEITGVDDLIHASRSRKRERMIAIDALRLFRLAPVPQGYGRSVMDQFTHFIGFAATAIFVDDENLRIRNRLTHRADTSIDFLWR